MAARGGVGLHRALWPHARAGARQAAAYAKWNVEAEHFPPVMEINLPW
jgi:hypothetical protein